MLPFYWVLTAIFVTIISWVGPVAAQPAFRSIFIEPCESALLTPIETHIVKLAKADPVALYFTLFERYFDHLKKTGSADFLVTDLFGEDFEILSNRVRQARDYFKFRGREDHTALANKILSEAKKLKKSGLGYVSYYAFNLECLQLFDLLIFERLKQTEEHEKYKKLQKFTADQLPLFRPDEEQTARKLHIQLNQSDKYKMDMYAFGRDAILAYHKFPYFALPTVSDTSRADIVIIASAPLFVRRSAVIPEAVDQGIDLPVENGGHDDSHAVYRNIVPHPEIINRFANKAALRVHLNQKLKASRFILQRVQEEKDPIEQLRLDQLVFSNVFENRFGSIEYFDPLYEKNLSRKPLPKMGPGNAFLSKAEGLLLQNTPDPFRHERRLKVEQWYQEALK